MNDRETIIRGIIKALKSLGKVPAYLNHAPDIRLTGEEVKRIAEETGLEAYKIYMKYG